MIVITGAGGKTGRAVVTALSRLERVTAFARSEQFIPTLKSLGASAVQVGDLRDPEAVREAMRAARAVYHLCPNMSPDEIEIGRLVIGKAREAGVEHFVYHSVLHPQTERMNHHWQKLRVEEMLFEAGLPFTILQPAPYMQNLLAGWKSIVEEGVLRVPYSVDSKFSFVDLEDVAEAASVVLRDSGHLNAVYELAGTQPLSHMEIAGILSAVLKRKVHAEQRDIEDWEARSGDMSDYARENLVRMFEYYDRWGLVGNPHVLGWLLGREPASLAAFFGRMAQS